MSSKGTRLTDAAGVAAYDWSGWVPTAAESRHPSAPAGLVGAAPAPSFDRAAVEREAFAQGYAQGERAGADAAVSRTEPVLQRLKQTIGELQALRAEMIHKTERQVVQLALAMARRIVHREISLDPELLSAMARVALDRLSDSATATIRLHPDDFAATGNANAEGRTVPGAVRVVADPVVRRGGCLVQSEFGVIDVSADAQIQELAAALLGSDDGQRRTPAEACLVE